eukprot:TRINITY_DN3232_c0_g1_i3.p8 TRINITY_DN3232_c0_g1~~TRINITY_DN3232_c0_g1_i3.p8  ORF type:complete len:102 (-),score=2.84 TRINITY_DN3232_c0_g1_i3:79-384(-)
MYKLQMMKVKLEPAFQFFSYKCLLNIMLYLLQLMVAVMQWQIFQAAGISMIQYVGRAHEFHNYGINFFKVQVKKVYQVGEIVHENLAQFFKNSFRARTFVE